MTFVVTENCIKCKYQDCVEVCPVDCFYEGPNFLVINPDECIDCALCEPECPANAIFSEDELPAGQEVFIELNAELSEKWAGNNITQIGKSLPIVKNGTASQTNCNIWKNKPQKTSLDWSFFIPEAHISLQLQHCLQVILH